MEKKLYACRGCKTCFSVQDATNMQDNDIDEFLKELPGTKVYLIEEEKFPNVKIFLATSNIPIDEKEENNFRYQIRAVGNKLMSDADEILKCVKELRGQISTDAGQVKDSEIANEKGILCKNLVLAGGLPVAEILKQGVVNG